MTYVRKPIDLGEPRCDIPDCVECRALARLYDGFAAVIEGWQEIVAAREDAVTVMAAAEKALSHPAPGDPDNLLARFEAFKRVAYASGEMDDGFRIISMVLSEFCERNLLPQGKRPIEAETRAVRDLVARASIANITLSGVPPALAAVLYAGIKRKSGSDAMPYVGPDDVLIGGEHDIPAVDSPDDVARAVEHYMAHNGVDDGEPLPFDAVARPGDGERDG